MKRILRGLPAVLLVLAGICGMVAVTFAPLVMQSLFGDPAGLVTIGVQGLGALLCIAYLTGEDEL